MVKAEFFMANDQGEWLLTVDGAAHGNPGDGGCGAANCDETGALVKGLSAILAALPIMLQNTKVC